MSNDQPPLPGPFDYCYEWFTQTGGVRRSFSGALYNGRGATNVFTIYTADQMREYGRARERAAYERAKRACLAIAYAPGYQAGKAQWVAECCAEAVGALGADK